MCLCACVGVLGDTNTTGHPHLYVSTFTCVCVNVMVQTHDTNVPCTLTVVWWTVGGISRRSARQFEIGSVPATTERRAPMHKKMLRFPCGSSKCMMRRGDGDFMEPLLEDFLLGTSIRWDLQRVGGTAPCLVIRFRFRIPPFRCLPPYSSCTS